MVVEFRPNCQNPSVMTKDEFLSRQKTAEHQIETRNKFGEGLYFMVLISMFFAVFYLTGIMLGTIFEKVPAYGLLWEIAFCLVVFCILKYRLNLSHRKTVANLKALGLRCPICDRSPIFDKGKTTALTGKCWHCKEHIFFTTT